MSVKDNISNNIAGLRKSRGWKQSELAEKLNYSDKAISKWERGESTPDVDSIAKIAKVFDVNIEFLFEEHDKIEPIEPETMTRVKNVMILCTLITGIYFISVVVFVYAHLQNLPTKGDFWIAFIWGTFISLIASTIFCKYYKYRIAHTYTLSATLWAGLATSYLQSLLFGENIWMVFLIGIPLQVGIILRYLFTKK